MDSLNQTGDNAVDELEALEELGIAEEAEKTADEKSEGQPSGGAEEDDRCVACHVNQIDTSENKNAILCKACRESHLHFHFPKGLLAMLTVVAAVFVCACIWLPTQLAAYRAYLDGGRAFSEKRYFDAEETFRALLLKYPKSVPIAVKLIDADMAHGDYESAVDDNNKYIADRNLDNAQYTKITAYFDQIGLYGDTVTDFDEKSKLIDKADMAAYNGRMIAVIDEMLASDKAYDKSLLYYWKGSYSDTDQGFEENLQKAIGENKNYTFFYSVLGNGLRSNGRFDEAKKEYETALAIDKTDAGALRGQAILSLLEGKAEEGLALALESNRIGPDQPYVRETVIIAYDQAGKRELAEQFLEETDPNSYSIDPDLTKYMNKEMDLQDYYLY